MDAAKQLDLAREEAPVSQVLNSPPQQLAPQTLPVPEEVTPPIDRSQSPKRSSHGAIPSTHQVKLKQKPPAQASISSIDASESKHDPFSESSNIVELQPIDRGFGAWSYIAAAFAMYIVVWGFPYAFPIFQTYLSVGPKARFPDSVAIRLLAPGLQDIEEGILFPFLPTTAKARRPIVLIGILIITISLILASYAQYDWQIVLAQGISFGVGGILLNFVHVSIFSEWFDKKKGQAMAIVWTGWRVGALGFPILCQWLLEEHGFEQTLRVLIAPMLSLLVPSLILFRGRYHAATVGLRPPRQPVSKMQALGTPSVLYYLCASCLFFLVANVPTMFITTFAADLAMKGSDQAIALVLLVLSNMLGTYLCGHLSDRIYHEGLTASIAISTSFAHMIGLGLAKTRSGVFLYAVAVGLAGGGFSNCLFTFYGDAAKGDSELFTAIHGLFSFFRGVAILSVGPIGAGLLRKAPAVDLSAFAITRYQYLLIYSASLSMASGLLILAKYIRRKINSRGD
ncbi:hypothetical protein LTR70_007178 [Exophiala xenobiotica]|uniref:Monocarboxylate transporter n=1 Tax=Lithohypha guttulata TaxID=1690604 RepID=A0ABR0KFN9_9EURO|nr:hypothetical protein LTR24_003265 [Lithohypha guttulata]KAK5314463.1 hypothetical protein LTR70_007178 [Exophiala xenobiotica]